MSKQAPVRGQEKQSQARKETHHQSRQVKRNKRKSERKFPWTIAYVVLVIVAVVGIYIFTHNGLAQAITNSTQPDQPVDNISCDVQEQTLQHIHAHVTLYVDNAQVTIPANIGIATDGSCYYWLHTHQIQGDSGVIHIEAPNTKTYVLGNFADIWRTRFSQLQYPIELDETTGWQAYVNGKPYNGNWRDIPLTSHEAITLAYNSPNIKPDTSFNFIAGE